MTTFIMGFGAGMLTGMAVDSLNPSVPRRPGSLEMDSGDFHRSIRELQRRGYLGDGSSLPSSLADWMSPEDAARYTYYLENGSSLPSTFADWMSPEDAAQYTHFLEYGSSSGLTPSELAGIQRLDDCLALGRVDYDEVLVLRRQNGTGFGDGIEDRIYSGDLMSPADAAQYSEHWRELGIGSDKTWNEFRAANPNGTIDDYFEIVQKQSPWPLGEQGNPVILKAGDRFFMAVENEAPENLIGGFGVREKIESTGFVRNNLAVKSDWKPTCNVIREFEVNSDVELYVNEGPVGPQIDLNADVYLPGDITITQYELFSNLESGINREDYVHIVDEYWVD